MSRFTPPVRHHANDTVVVHTTGQPASSQRDVYCIVQPTTFGRCKRDEHYVGSSEGVIRTYGVKRLPKCERPEGLLQEGDRYPMAGSRPGGGLPTVCVAYSFCRCSFIVTGCHGEAMRSSGTPTKRALSRTRQLQTSTVLDIGGLERTTRTRRQQRAGARRRLCSPRHSVLQKGSPWKPLLAHDFEWLHFDMVNYQARRSPLRQESAIEAGKRLPMTTTGDHNEATAQAERRFSTSREDPYCNPTWRSTTPFDSSRYAAEATSYAGLWRLRRGQHCQ